MAARAGRREWLLAGAVLATALNLRMAVASVPPLIDDIRASVPLSATAAGALTTLPVVCMGLGATVAPGVSRRVGHEAALALVGLTMAGGIVLRLLPGVVALYAGTAIAGISIALGNVIVPSLVKRDFHRQVGPMTGAYTMAISASAGIAAGLTVPIENAIGQGWRAALAVWALPALVAAAVWVPVARRAAGRTLATGDERPQVPPSLSRDRLAWQVTLFMGFQSLTFYGLLAWLPSVLHDSGISKGAAGAYLSVFTLLGIPICLLVPLLVQRLPDQRPLVAAAVALLVAGIVGLIVSPAGAPIVWTLLLGIAQSANLVLAFLFFALRTRDEPEAAALSSMAQSVGYMLAAVSPPLLGALHAATGGWTLPLLVLLVLLLPVLLAGLGAGRDRRVRARSPRRASARSS